MDLRNNPSNSIDFKDTIHIERIENPEIKNPHAVLNAQNCEGFLGGWLDDLFLISSPQ